MSFFLSESNRKIRKKLKYFLVFKTHPNWFGKTGYAVRRPAAAAAANGNPGKDERNFFSG